MIGRSRRWLARHSAGLRVVLFAAAGAVLGLAVGGQVSSDIGPFATTASVHPALRGETTVKLAPLGSIRLDTHAGPVRMALEVDELRTEEAERIARDPSVLGQLEEGIAEDARRTLVGLGLRCALVAVLGGVIGALAARFRWRSAAAGGAVAAVLVAVLGGVTAASFEPEAVAEPEYSGLLTMAPTAVGDVEAIIDRFGEYRAQLTELVGNVVTLYRAGEGLPVSPLGADSVRVLHVSDIHNNPQAFDLMAQLVRQFDVDAVLDTGDIGDWGTEAEAQLLLERIARLPVPYLWVRGNHDSPLTQQVVAAQPNAVVLDGQVTEIAGLRIWGVGDPRYTPDKDQPTGSDVERKAAAAFAPQVERRLRGTGRVDVVAVHDARIAADLGDRVPLVLAGHTHNARQSRLGRATVLVEGSTGGAGLRALDGEAPEPLACSVLYFAAETRRLVAYDRITVAGLGGTGARIDRHLIGSPVRAEARPTG